MGLQPTVGFMKPHSPRANMWRNLFGSLEVPLRLPVPHSARTGDTEIIESYYHIDVSRIPDDKLEVLCQMMAEQFNQPIEVVREGVRGEHGLPIRASEIEVISFDARHAL